MSKSWSMLKLSEVLRRRMPDITVDPTQNYQFAGVYSFGRGVFRGRELQGSQFAYRTLTRLGAGEFVYPKLMAWEGAFGVVPAACDGHYVSPEFPVFEVNVSRLEPRFLGFYFQIPAVWKRIAGGSTGTNIRRQRLDPSVFLEREIPLPGPAEQRRIVARIEDLAAQIREAGNLRQQSMDALGKMLETAVSCYFPDEQYWTSVGAAVLGRKGAVRSGPFGSQLLHEEFVESGVAAIGTRVVQTNHFDLKNAWFVRPEKFDELRRYQVFPDDVLCTIIGASIGRFCVVPQDVPLAFTTKHIQALTLDTKVVHSPFVTYMLNFHHRCRESMFSQVEGSAQPSLNAEKVLATNLPLPPLSEQRRIVAELDALQTQVDAVKSLQAETAAELDALLPSILDKAFRGEL